MLRWENKSRSHSADGLQLLTLPPSITRAKETQRNSDKCAVSARYWCWLASLRLFPQSVDEGRSDRKKTGWKQGAKTKRRLFLWRKSPKRDKQAQVLEEFKLFTQQTLMSDSNLLPICDFIFLHSRLFKLCSQLKQPTYISTMWLPTQKWEKADNRSQQHFAIDTSSIQLPTRSWMVFLGMHRIVFVCNCCFWLSSFRDVTTRRTSDSTYDGGLITTWQYPISCVLFGLTPSCYNSNLCPSRGNNRNWGTWPV